MPVRCSTPTTGRRTTPVACFTCGQRVLGDQGGAHHVRLEGGAPPLGVGGVERNDRDGTGRVDDVVEAAETRDRVLDHLPALLLVGDVAREADGGAVDLGGGLLAHLTAPRGQGHVCARRAEPLRDHAPDPRGRAHAPAPDALPADCHPSSPLSIASSCSYHIAAALIWRRGRASGQHDRHMVAIRSRLPRSILVLRHRDFALVQLGNGVSQLGTWGQYVALGWAIRELSGWPFAVSLSLVAQFLPVPAALARRRRARRPAPPPPHRGARQRARGAVVDRARRPGRHRGADHRAPARSWPRSGASPPRSRNRR